MTGRISYGVPMGERVPLFHRNRDQCRDELSGVPGGNAGAMQFSRQSVVQEVNPTWQEMV